MTTHDWTQTAWQDEKGNRTTLQYLLSKLINSEVVKIKLSDLSHIPSVQIDEQRKRDADLSFPIIVQQKNDQYIKILDGHHRRQKALDNNKNVISAKLYEGELF